MMSGRKEPDASNFRHLRHKHLRHLIAQRAKEGYNSTYAREVYLTGTIKKLESGTATVRVAEKIVKFFETERSQLCSAEAKRPSTNKPVVREPLIDKNKIELHFVTNPAELSLDDLPSPHSHSDFGLIGAGFNKQPVYSDMDFNSKFENCVLRCPALVAYLHKRREKVYFY